MRVILMMLPNKRIIFPVTILTVTLVCCGCYKQQEHKTSGISLEQQASVSQVKVVDSAQGEGVQPSRKQELPANIYGRNDPFAPIGSKSDISTRSERGELILEGIMTGSGRPLAMINGRIVREGESIEKKRIIKIDTDSVILEDEHGLRDVLRIF